VDWAVGDFNEILCGFAHRSQPPWRSKGCCCSAAAGRRKRLQIPSFDLRYVTANQYARYHRAKAAAQAQGLRQKVTELEQELAQRPATAKAARPEGLAMKALKAAMTKPDTGVVGFYDASLEFHEGDCPPPYPLSMQVNQELVNDVDKRIRASNKLLDTQQQNLGRVFAVIDDITSGDEDGENIS
jgi:hypothetical protein